MYEFNYDNTESVLQKGGKMVRKVSIKNGKGYKSITKYRRGKKLYTIKKPIHKEHIKLIKKGKFIPGLFRDCKGCKTKKRRGGGDIEEGKVEPPVVPYPVPADPERLKKYERDMVAKSFKPATTEEVEKVFEGPHSQQIEDEENRQMRDNDPALQDPFIREPLNMWGNDED